MQSNTDHESLKFKKLKDIYKRGSEKVDLFEAVPLPYFTIYTLKYHAIYYNIYYTTPMCTLL